MNLIFLILLSSCPAIAITGQEVCDKDVAYLCSGIEKGEGRVGKCLREKNTQIALDCRAFWESFRAERIKIKNDCYPYVRKFCSQVKPGNGRVVKCLKEHLPENSGECRAALDKIESF